MLAYTYISHGKFELIDKPKPELHGPRDAIVCIILSGFFEETTRSKPNYPKIKKAGV